MDYLSPFRSITGRIVATTSKYTMPSPPIFSGPPEIYPLPSPAPSRKPSSLLSPFIDAMTALFEINNNNLVLEEEEEAVPIPKPPMWFIKKLSPSFQSSGNPCLDLFNMLLFTPPEKVTELLRRAWAHNPLTTLKLILRRMLDCNRRYCHDDKKVFSTVVFWLHQNHPKTLALNVTWFAQVGYIKYLIDIIFLEVASPDALKLVKEDEERGLRTRIECPRAALPRPELARSVVERYNSDSNYRLLYDRISDFFAESLKTDIGFLNSGEFRKIGRAATWCPSLHSSLDYSTLPCDSIAKRVFPRESDPSYAQMDEAHYYCIVRMRLWKEILYPLIRFLMMQGGVPQRAPSGVVEGEALLPHGILSFQGNNMDVSIDDVKEFQWKRIVEDLSKEGKLSNCLSVRDVSGSMGGTPMEVCVALGLLASELSEEPWRGNVINFSENPQLHRIQGETSQEKTKFIKRMEWGMNIDFQKVFDIILDVAVASKLEGVKMVKRVFVFSDMGFAEASENSWETDYRAIQRKYEEKGYGSSVPEIVFWKFRDLSLSIKPPVTGREKGAVQVHGLSNNLLNIFLDNGGVVNPEDVMEEAIAKEYQGPIAKECQGVSVFD